MNTHPLKGLTLFLVLAGIFLTLVGAMSVVVTGDRRLLLVAAVGCALQFVGWRRHASRAGGA